MCICILSYYNYNGTEYLDDHYTVLPECYQCLFSYLYPLHHPWGCFVHLLGEDTVLVHPIEVYPYNCLVLGLKCSGHSYMYQIVPLLLALFVYMYELQSVLYLIILRVPPLMISWEYPSDIIRGGSSLSYSNKLWYQQ